LTYFSSCQLTRAEAGAGPSVVWLRGDHDVATVETLRHTITEAIALGEPAVVIDLSEVHFLSAATLGVLVAAHATLGAHSRRLVVRVASPFVRRIFEVTGLVDLLDGPSPEDAPDTLAGDTVAPDTVLSDALGTWVEVPPTARLGWSDAPVTLGPGAGGQGGGPAPHERPLFVRIP
jgi:anti-sigma B factor antagonist